VLEERERKKECAKKKENKYLELVYEGLKNLIKGKNSHILIFSESEKVF